MKRVIGVFGFFCCLSLGTCCVPDEFKNLFLGASATYNLSEAYLEPQQLIRKKGYPSEMHTVLTQDGYLLDMNRIPYGLRGGKMARKGPVLLQHGFLGKSIDWLLLKPEKDLAFMLADDGYDVWLGNFRGNTHARAHQWLTPCDNKFWDFTWHESGLYDLSAMIDYVLEKTGAATLEYIGHSVGTTSFLVLMSMRPEYNQKISKAHLLAPMVFLRNLQSPLLSAFDYIIKFSTLFPDLFTKGPLLADSEIYKSLRDTLCSLTPVKKEICTQAVFLITGVDPEQLDEDIMGALTYHYPSGYAVKALNHYSQVYVSGEFKMYDYGLIKNSFYYGSKKPPYYDLDKVTVPIVLYVGINDYLSTMDDARLIKNALNSVEELFVVDYLEFNHLDFLFATDAKLLLYDEIIKRLT